MTGVAALAPAGARALSPGITTIILAFNEECHIERAIANARAFSADILVVDSFSTDRTVELARAAGARVLQNPWTNHARQFQWALDRGGIATQWVLRLDADELIGADLARRINAELPGIGADVAGIMFDRRHIFMGRWVRHGGRYPLRLLRLWRTGQGSVEDRWMDEHVRVHGGRTIRMAGEFADAAERDLGFLIDKHNGYATREAVEILNERYSLFDSAATGAEGSGAQARLKRFIKRHVYNRLPFGVGPVAYFLYRYFFQLGFLDGRSGFIYHFMQGLWYRMLVDAKLVELEAAIADCDTRETRLAALRRVTGLKL